MKMHRRSCRTGPRALALEATLLTILMTALPMAAAGAAPAADPSGESIKDPHRVHVCGSGRSGVTLEADGQQLSLTRREGDRVTTTVVDMDQIGRLVGDAVGEAMVALEDLQLQVRLGQDNRVNVATAKGQFEVDLDEIMTQVAAAVQSGLRDIDTATWTSTGQPGAVRDEDLQFELAELREEMRALRAELRRLRDQAGSAPADGH